MTVGRGHVRVVDGDDREPPAASCDGRAPAPLLLWGMSPRRCGGSVLVLGTRVATLPAGPGSETVRSTVGRRNGATVGQRVGFRCRVVRAVGVAEYVVTADGVQFGVVAEPASPPCGPSTSTFIVAGSTLVHYRGRTSLPELVVDTCGR